MLASSRLSISSQVRSWCTRESDARFFIGLEIPDIPGVERLIPKRSTLNGGEQNLCP